MKNEKLFRSVGEIGEDLITEAAEYGTDKAGKHKQTAPRGNLFRRAGLVAAVMAVVIAAVFVIPALFGRNRNPAHNIKTELPVNSGIVLNGGAYDIGAVAELPESLRSVEVSANGSGEKLIPTNSTLVIKTAAECDTETLVKYVSVTPEMPMAVTKVSATEFHIKPAQTSFAPNTVYRVTVGDPANPYASFAFQTVNELAVKNILPANESVGVPLDTGIEITFTDALENADFAKYITLSPEVDGRFVLYPNGRTVAFVPENGLEPESVYTVTVSEGLRSISGKTLEKGETAVFRTASKTEGLAQLHASLNCFVDGQYKSSGDPVSPGAVLTYNINAESKVGSTFTATPKVKAELYRAKSWKHAESAAIRFYTGYFTKGFDISSVLDEYFEKISEPDVIYNGPEKYLLSYTAEEEGFYYIVFTVEIGNLTRVLSDVFQVSALRLGGISKDGKAVTVVSDDTGKRIPGAAIHGVCINTDNANGADPETSVLDAVCVSDGTAVLKYVGDILVLTYTDGVRTAMAFKAVDTSEYRDRYIYALYTDRSVYFANDTVNIWGNVRGLYGAGIPRELYVFTGFCAVGTPVAVDADGTFRTSAKIENAMRTQTFVRVEDAEGNVLAYTYITVTEEEKPVLNASMSLDKTHCFYGETVTATVKVTFFDGTPAEGYEVGVLCSKFPVYKTVTTDANGCAEFNINTGYIKAYGTQPICISANAYVSGEGTDRIECAGSFMYFHSDLVLKASGRTLTLNELDRSKCPEYAAGAPAEGKVKYRLIKVTYEKHTYKEYDNYLKRMMERTRYDRIESCESIGALQFENGRIELPEVKAKDENEYYYYKITFTDVHNTYEMSLPASGSSYGAYYYEPNAAHVTLDKESYLEGDKVKARFVPGINTNADAVTVFTGRSYISHASGTEAEFVFTEELLPEVLVSVLYFDLGKHVWRTERTSAKFDYASALDGNISVTADRSEYRPGDTAVITVTSPALAGGKAIVSIVDEACFALGENDFNVLDYLKSCGYIQKYVYGSAYRNMYFSNVNGLNTVFDNVALMWQFNDRGYSALNSGGTKFSLIDGIYYESNYLLDGVEGEAIQEAEPGTNNAESSNKSYYVRESFADNPVFAELDFDSDGVATLTFQVPDNLTSWRVTVLGVKNAEKFSAIKLAQSVSDTVCTLPFFVKADICSTYVKGDDIALSAHSFGAKAQGKVNYTAVLANSYGDELARNSVSGEAKAFTGINFGKLDEGVYSVTVYADNGEDTDAVKSVFSVVSSSLIADVVKTVDLKDLKTLEPAAYPVDLVISGDESDGEYTSALHRLYNLYAVRADAAAAKYAATVIMQMIYGGDIDPAGAMRAFASYVDYSGAKLFPYGESDTELTALIAGIAPELLAGRTNVYRIFESMLEKGEFKTETELCAVLYGLASYGAPVLDVLYSVTSRAADFPDEAKLYLACAFAAAGDYSAALSIYSDVAEKYATDVENAMYFKADDEETTVKLTSLALTAASRIKRTDALKLARYALNIPNTHGESSDLALAAFIKYYLPVSEQALSKICYTLADGVKHEAEIGFGRQLRLTLYKADLESLVLENCEKAHISVRSAERVQAGNSGSGKVKIEKTVNGDVVTITVSGTADRYWESFTLSDVIPSGARYLYTMNYSDASRGANSFITIYNRAGQRMEGHVSVSAPESYWRQRKDNAEFCAEYAFSVTVSYRIRKAVSGEFTVEPAALISNRSGETVYSQSGGVLVYN